MDYILEISLTQYHFIDSICVYVNEQKIMIDGKGLCHSKVLQIDHDIFLYLSPAMYHTGMRACQINTLSLGIVHSKLQGLAPVTNILVLVMTDRPFCGPRSQGDLSWGCSLILGCKIYEKYYLVRTRGGQIRQVDIKTGHLSS